MRRRRTSTEPTAGCFAVARALQTFLDGETDDITTARLARHLEHCRRCGLEARTYAEIKASLARRIPAVDELALGRLRAFAVRMVETPPPVEDPRP